MHHDASTQTTFLTLIAGRNQKGALLTALLGLGVRLTSIFYGRGSVKAGVLKNLLGLVPEEHKVVITCMTTSAKADEALKMLVEQFHFNKPNTGIAFTTPVDKLSY